jgi:hypothetical protein
MSTGADRPLTVTAPSSFGSDSCQWSQVAATAIPAATSSSTTNLARFFIG